MNDTISRLAVIQIIEQMRARIGHNLERSVGRAMIEILDEVGKDVGKLPSAQPYTTTPDGRLWITVDDIDKVTAVVVDEHKSKFCKQFYEDYEDAQPDIIRCKDCKYWDTTWQNDYAPNYHYCPMIDSTRRNDFYCADAERRTDG